MSGYLSLRAITYRTHSLNLIHLELPPSFTACLIDFRFPLNVFPILFLLTPELFMFRSALSFPSCYSLPVFFFFLAYFVSALMSSPPESWAACDLHLTLPSFLCCSFSNTNLCAGLPGCLAQCEPCVSSSRVLLEQIPQGLNRPCYLLSPFFCVPCVHKFPWKQGNSEQRPLRNVDAFFLKQIYSSCFLLCCSV